MAKKANTKRKKTKKAPLTCDHGGEGWPSFEALPPPKEKSWKCRDCGALGYRRARISAVKGSGQRPGRIVLYCCRVKGCKGVVIERTFGSGWQLSNGCAEHPVP